MYSDSPIEKTALFPNAEGMPVGRKVYIFIMKYAGYDTTPKGSRYSL
jgi:hypothetical protein